MPPKFLSDLRFIDMQLKSQALLLRLWAVESGFPIPTSREWVEKNCYGDGTEFSEVWFYRHIYNFRVFGFIELFIRSDRTQMLYFQDRREDLLAREEGPFAPGSEPCQGGRWIRFRDADRPTWYGMTSGTGIKVDTAGGSNAPIPPQDNPRHKQRRGR